MVQFGVTLPNLGIPGGVRALADLAAEAEGAGWDGVFIWDSVASPDWNEWFATEPLLRAEWNPWVVLGAMATATTRVRLGTMVTPLPRRRPWQVAAEVATLDHLSAGRAVLPVSLGWLPDGAFAQVNEERDRRTRAERLDESLEVITALWSGEPVEFAGRHYTVDGLLGIPTVQQPRPPVWVVAAWPRRRSLDRAKRWDGAIPAALGTNGEWGNPSPDDVAGVAAELPDRDVVVEGNTSRDTSKAAAKIAPFIAAGTTWWLEGVWSFLQDREHGLDRIRARIAAGPPSVAVDDRL